MATNKTYWKSVDQLDDQNELVQKLEEKEFAEQLPVDSLLEDQQSLEKKNKSE